MRLYAGVTDMRPGYHGLHRPKTASHQACGWSMGPVEQRLDVSSLKPMHAKRSNALCISARPCGSATSLLCEEDIFQFDSGNDLHDNKQGTRKYSMEGLIAAQGLDRSSMEGSLGGKTGMLKICLKRSPPMDVTCTQMQGGIEPVRPSTCTSGIVHEVKTKSPETQTCPIDIPGFMQSQSATRHGRAKSEQEPSFIPPHIFAARMNNSDAQIPGSCRPRGLSSLRMRTAVLAETGYLDGYTEMGQKPSKSHVRHNKHVLCT